MASNFKVAIVAKIAELDALRVLLNNGFLDLYDGAQPASPETGVTTQIKLARLTFGAAAFLAAIDNGDGTAKIVANAIGSDTDADATTATGASWFRARKSDETAIADGTVGTIAGYDAVINAVTIQQHTRVDCLSMVIRL
jgi:hypothetical protein